MRVLVPFSLTGRVAHMAENKQLVENPHEIPLIPTKLKETGLNGKFVTALLLKTMHVLGLETNIDIAGRSSWRLPAGAL